ncbi:MAG: diadenylate cyclase CdaA [Oscillospiraceae bacterium]|nr:diadenylate cyclase CdaA [Oscillospiraceae bacterium]
MQLRGEVIVLAFLDSVNEFLRVAGNLISAMTIADFIDIAIVAFIIYKVLSFARRTSAGALIWGIVLVLVVLGISQIAKLTVISYLLGRAVELGVIAIIVLFQPEIRGFLTSAGSSVSGVFARSYKQATEIAVSATVEACEDMSRTKTGALIVFERNVHLEEYIKSGTKLDSAASAELLLQIFYPNTPLHDGAVIISDGRVVAAGCMLPMSSSNNLSRELGMRHRAGIGLSERSDAVVAIVSEESGGISVAINGMLKRNLDPETFEMLLKKELVPEKDGFMARIRNVLRRNNA